MSGYCAAASGHALHGPYHDAEHGFPLDDDAALLERFALEINQAGLSWLLMLKKRDAFRKAFRGFDIDRVARAVIENARRIRALRTSHGSFAAWIAAHHPRTKAEWVKLFRNEFVFTGGEIVGEFLMSIGYLPGAHHARCPVHRELVKIAPPWMQARGFKY